MAKPTKPRAAFQIPTVEEVANFISIKMRDWPEVFCLYMAEKFHNHYTARGWRLSANVLMRDFKAAFCAQWQTLKFKEDKDYLEVCLRSLTHKATLAQRRRESAGLFREQEAALEGSSLDRMLDHLDMIRISFEEGKASDAQLRTACDWLRAQKLLILKKEQIEAIIIEQGNDRNRGALLAIKQFFTNLRGSGLTVKQYVHLKLTQQEKKEA